MARCQTIFLDKPSFRIGSLFITAILVVVFQVANASESVGSESEQKTRFHRTVEALADESEDVRSEFAMLALQQLALSHALEAQLAREELAASSDRAKLHGWSMAVDRYADDLTRMVREVREDSPVMLSFMQHGSIAISVAGRMVMLTHPRYAQQRALEQNILTEFCSQHACDVMFETSPQRSTLPVMTATVRPDWNFTEQGYLCSHQGIRLTFRPGGELRRQRQACTAIIQELMRLHDEIAWQLRHSVKVSWQEIALFKTPRGIGHRVQLNRVGDSILLDLPLLEQNVALLQEAALWLQKRLELLREDARLELDASDLNLPAD